MDELEQMFHHFENESIEDLTIFIRYRKDEGRQMWIRFKGTYDNYTSMNITHFSKYRRLKETTEKVSLFGNDNNKIVFYLTMEFLNNLVSVGDSHEFVLGMGINCIPCVEDCIYYIVDKTESDYSSNKECPICYTDYKIKSSVRLNCDHKVCRDCFFKILENHSLKCPICKDPLISTLI